MRLLLRWKQAEVVMAVSAFDGKNLSREEGRTAGMAVTGGASSSLHVRILIRWLIFEWSAGTGLKLAVVGPERSGPGHLVKTCTFQCPKEQWFLI
jgi:hypothetical protein